jgi:hypothetical protein
MKKIILGLALTIFSTSVDAGPYHGHRHHHHRHWKSPPAHHWVAPLIIGGIAGAVIANQRNDTQTIIVNENPKPSVVYDMSNVPSLTCPLGTMLIEEKGWFKDQHGRPMYGSVFSCQ